MRKITEAQAEPCQRCLYLAKIQTKSHHKKRAGHVQEKMLKAGDSYMINLAKPTHFQTPGQSASTVEHHHLQLHCRHVLNDHSELELIWEQRSDDVQPQLFQKHSCSACQSHPFREGSVGAEGSNPEALKQSKHPSTNLAEEDWNKSTCIYLFIRVYVYRYIYTYVYICIHVYIPTSICEKTETYVVASDSSHDLHNIALILLSKAESNFDTGSSPTSHPHA